MTDDLLIRAEAWLKNPGNASYLGPLVRELVAALRATTEEREFQRARADKWVSIAEKQSLEIEDCQQKLTEAFDSEVHTVAALRAHEWQSIDTAPKDERSMLVHNNAAPGLPTGRAEKCWGANTAVAAWWDDEGEDGRWVCYMDAISDPLLHFTPTHWMPLPDPPAQGTP
jgi:hypothetical protein